MKKSIGKPLQGGRLVLLLLFYCCSQVWAQDHLVSFKDSTKLSPAVWEGTLDRFACTPQGLRLQDSNPGKTSNQAHLGCKITNAPTLSWSGSLEFDMLPTSRNRVDILLYPLNSTQDSKGMFHTRYMALSVGKEKRAELHCVRVSQESATSPIVFEARETIIANKVASDFTKATTNKLDYIVSFDATSSLWTLFAHNHSHYLPSQFIAIGSEVYEDDYQYLDSKWIKTRVCITYSKSNASAVLLKSLGFYTRILEPDNEGKPNGSIIDEVAYDGTALKLLCVEKPNIENARFLLEPTSGDLTGIVEGYSIFLPLPTTLSAGSYRLAVSGIAFQDGRISPPEEFAFDILGEENPDEKEQNHPLLSEIMPYPEVDGTEFIELFNPSEKTIDLRNYGFMLRREGRPSKAIPLEVTNYLMRPKDFMVLTPWRESLVEQFPSLDSYKIAELSAFPSLPNTEGQLVLIRLSDKATLESFAYDYKSYAPDTKKRGYSLERIDYTQRAHDESNWQAASKEAGYATPGKPNSRHVPPDKDKEKETDSENPSSLRYIVRRILATDSIEGSKVRLTFFSLKGEKLATWHHHTAHQWAKEFEKGANAPLLPNRREAIVLLCLEIREGQKGKPHSYSILLFL